jgi:sRNA-binding regulator protein Hfq
MQHSTQRRKNMVDDNTTVQKDKPLAGAEGTVPVQKNAKILGGSAPQFLPKLLGQKLTLRMIAGQPVTGELIGYNAYEILLKTPKGPFLIFKGAIMWIEGGSY